jgi:hypothetical protein
MRSTHCLLTLRNVTLPEPRLATHMIVSAFVRRAAEQGDFATVLVKGDPTAGELLLKTRIKGQFHGLFEQFPVADCMRNWTALSAQAIENEQKADDFLERRQQRDPDLWILELDVAFPERLGGLLTSST